MTWSRGPRHGPPTCRAAAGAPGPVPRERRVRTASSWPRWPTTSVPYREWRTRSAPDLAGTWRPQASPWASRCGRRRDVVVLDGRQRRPCPAATLRTTPWLARRRAGPPSHRATSSRRRTRDAGCILVPASVTSSAVRRPTLIACPGLRGASARNGAASPTGPGLLDPIAGVLILLALSLRAIATFWTDSREVLDSADLSVSRRRPASRLAFTLGVAVTLVFSVILVNPWRNVWPRLRPVVGPADEVTSAGRQLVDGRCQRVLSFGSGPGFVALRPGLSAANQ